MTQLASSVCLALRIGLGLTVGGCLGRPAFAVGQVETPFGTETGAVLYLDLGQWTAIEFTHRPDGYRLGAMFALNGISATRIEAGGTLHLALDTGGGAREKIELPIEKHADPVVTQRQNVSMTQWMVRVQLSPLLVARLRSAAVRGAEIDGTYRIVLDQEQATQFLSGVEQVIAKAGHPPGTKIPATSTATRNKTHGDN